MADLPEYKKNRHAVEPSQGVGGIAQTYSNVAQSISNSAQGTAWIGEIGASIAQDAANQLSTIRGQEEAIRNPGRQLLPAFTESDKHFVKAFEEEAYVGFLYSGDSLINEQYRNVSNGKINSNSFDLLQKNTIPLLEKMINDAPSNVRAKLKHHLFQNYSNKYYKLSNKFIKQSLNDTRFNVHKALEQNLKGIIDDGISGHKDSAARNLKDSLDIIDNSEKNGILTHKQAQVQRDAFFVGYQSALQQVNVEDILNKKGEKEAWDYRKEYSDEKPEGMSKEMHQSVVNQIDKTILNNASEQNLDKDANLLAMNIKKKEGSLSADDIVKFSSDIGSSNWAKYNQLQSVGDKRYKKLLLSEIQIGNSIKNGRHLGTRFTRGEIVNYTQRQIDKVKSKLGRDLTTLEQAAVHYHVNDSRSGFGSELNDWITYGNGMAANNAVQVLNEYKDIPDAKFLEKVSEKARLTANIYSSILKSNPDLPVNEAIKIAKNQAGEFSEEEQKIRLGLYHNNFGNREKTLNDATFNSMEICNELLKEDQRKWFGNTKFEAKDVPTKLIGDYNENFKRLFIAGKDEKAASEETTRMLKEVWGVSNFNGEPEITEKPIEKLIKGTPFTTTQIKNKLIVQLSELFSNQQKIFEEDQAPYYYKFSEGEITEINKWLPLLETGKPIYKNKTMKTEKIYNNKNGKPIIEKGYIKIISDKKTILDRTNEDTSYQVRWFSDKTKDSELIYSSNNIRNGVSYIRFYPFEKNKKTNNKKAK